MGSLLTAIPALAVLVANLEALTRSSRLRSVIKANVELLDSLPDDYPSRTTLAAHIEALVDTLVQRQCRQFQLVTTIGGSFGVTVTLAGLALLPVIFAGLELIGVLDTEPQTRQNLWLVLAFYAGLGIYCGRFAFRA
jgi:pimeloyl-ACP methyl ester carboxylesterase